MSPQLSNPQDPDVETTVAYTSALSVLMDRKIPFTVGGGFALEHYVGLGRCTKDLDIFVRPTEVQRILETYAAAGYRTEFPFPHWLGKVFIDDFLIDVIFSSGNGVARVDDLWLARAVEGDLFGLPVLFCTAEDIIWSKGLIMERERFDGSDIAHLFRALGPMLDWPHLVRRFGDHWRVLLAHLVLFGFIYPSDRDQIPKSVIRELVARWEAEMEEPPPSERVCYGTLLSRSRYLVDVEQWGYEDARLPPRGNILEYQLAIWTAAIPPEP